MIYTKQCSSLDKILPLIECNAGSIGSLSALQGEQLSYQIAFKTDSKCPLTVTIESVIKKKIKPYLIGTVPVMMPTYPQAFEDDNYISHEPGIFPDPMNHIDSFIGEVEELWGYYCCSQHTNVSNRFIAMPSYRNRSIAPQLFKYNIKGFLQWGYNFYYTQYSKRQVNPFTENDADMAFAAGDSFSVYPAPDGPIPAIGLAVFREALKDLRAFRLLEGYIGHEGPVALIEDVLGTVRFDKCADSSGLILKMRQKVNNEIKKHIN